MRPAVPFAFLAALFTVTAADAAEVTIHNCSKYNAHISSFNRGDVLKAIPYMQVNVASETRGSANCNSDRSCDLRIRIENTMQDIDGVSGYMCLTTIDFGTYTRIYTDRPCTC